MAAPPERLAAGIHDGVRYTLVWDDEVYSAGVGEAVARLREAGYEPLQVAPRWQDPFYRGVNSCWDADRPQRVR